MSLLCRPQSSLPPKKYTYIHSTTRRFRYWPGSRPSPVAKPRFHTSIRSQLLTLFTPFKVLPHDSVYQNKLPTSLASSHCSFDYAAAGSGGWRLLPGSEGLILTSLLQVIFVVHIITAWRAQVDLLLTQCAAAIPFVA